METSFLKAVAELLAERGVATYRFEFGYMAARRQGTRKPPPKAERLMDEYRAAVAAVPAGAPLIIGGKSMGGRVASLVADELYCGGPHRRARVPGLSVPSAQKPEQLRTAHLAALACPALIVQGERDPFGTRAEVEAYRLSPAIRFHWAADGDHDLGPRGASGFTRKGNLAAAAERSPNSPGARRLGRASAMTQHALDIATCVGSALRSDPTYAGTGCARGRRCGSMRTAPRMIAATLPARGTARRSPSARR